MAKGKYQKWLSDDGLLQLAAWARDGLTNEQIASNVGVSQATLYEWMNRYPEISEALKRGKEIVDIVVENALLKRALGYNFTEEKIEANEKGGKVTKTIKHIPADTTALIYWLKNRKPADWRDRPIIQGSDDDKMFGIVILPEILAE